MKILDTIFLVYLGICFLASLWMMYKAYQATQLPAQTTQYQQAIVTATFKLTMSDFILSLMLCASSCTPQESKLP